MWRSREATERGERKGNQMMRVFGVLVFLCVFPCFGALTLEERVGQLLMVHFHGEVANEDARILIQETGVGGIIYYNWSNGLSSPEQVRILSEGLQKMVRGEIPLLIATDQEGGIVARLTKGFTLFPGNRALGETGDSSLAEAAALAMGQELLSVGINMNLAPVVDINSNPRNPVIGIRSFGDQPERVLEFGEKALEGYHQAGIIATLKHFPGHGDVEVDSHEDLPLIRKSMEELEKTELLPFAKLDADAIMTAHLLVPAFDEEHCSTLSENTLCYLRDRIGFQGVIITDSLVMEGLLKKCHSIDEAAIQALCAGCDILLLGGKQLIGGHANLELSVSDVQRIHRSIVQAVKTGRLSEQLIDQSVRRVLALKERLKNPSMQQRVNPQEIAQKIASLAVKTTQNNYSISSLNQKKIAVFAPQIVRENILQTSLLEIGKTTESCFFSDLNPTHEEIEAAKKQGEAAEVLIVCSYNAWKNPSQTNLIHSLLELGKPLILLVMRDPLDASLFSQADLVFKTFSPTVPSIQAVCDHLKERYDFLSLSSEDAYQIGEKIWRNECNATLEGLTHWNRGENFASLGIGHFIWYSVDNREAFQESFPALLHYLREEGITLPTWLESAHGCPWNSRDAFYNNIQSPEMKSLRTFLFDTRHLQAIFIAQRLENALPQIIEKCSLEERERITAIFFKLAKDPHGLFALIDYLNFKGTGLSPNETYNGEGWGLLQVLQALSPSSPTPLADFVKAGKAVLAQRVENAPPERGEARWLKGWFKRLDDYLSISTSPVCK